VKTAEHSNLVIVSAGESGREILVIKRAGDQSPGEQAPVA